MIRSRYAASRRRFTSELEAAFREEHPPGDVAASFSFGVFITTLPTLGIGLLLFALIAKTVERASTIALFAPVILLNPVAKWGVYALSFSIGSLILGPLPGGIPTDLSLSGGSDVATRLMLGNLVLAFTFALIGYVAVFHGVTAYRGRDIKLVENLTEASAED